MAHFYIFQKVTLYKIVGEIEADTPEQAIDIAKCNRHCGFAMSDIRDQYGCLKDDTGPRAEIGELVARKSKWSK